MANTNGPNGFRVALHYSGGVVRRSRYHIAGAYANNIAVGDAVTQANTTKNITRPGSGSAQLIGVFDGCYYLDPNQPQPQYNRLWPAAQAVVTGSTPDAWVYDDPSTLFEVQASAAFALANIGQNANVVLGAENLFTKTSADALDSTSYTNSAAVLRVMDYVNRPDNAVGSFARLLVLIGNHFLGPVLTGV